MFLKISVTLKWLTELVGYADILINCRPSSLSSSFLPSLMLSYQLKPREAQKKKLQSSTTGLWVLIRV